MMGDRSSSHLTTPSTWTRVEAGRLDEDLAEFVSQVEGNTFSIVSMWQKFNLMRNSGNSFREEAERHLAQFDARLQNLRKTVSTTFGSLSSRLMDIESKSFRPREFHPVMSVEMQDTYQLVSCCKTSRGYVCGSDNAKVFFFKEDGGRLILEEELLLQDGGMIIKIGFCRFGGTDCIACKGSTGSLYIVNIDSRAIIDKFVCRDFDCLGRTDIGLPESEQYSLFVIQPHRVVLVADKQNIAEIAMDATLIAATPRLVGIYADKKLSCFELVSDFETPLMEFSCEFEFKSMTASDEFFCLLSRDSTKLSLVNHKGGNYVIELQHPVTFVSVVADYILACGDTPEIVVYSSQKSKESFTIGEGMEVHKAEHPINHFEACHDCLMTCQDNKFVVWS